MMRKPHSVGCSNSASDWSSKQAAMGPWWVLGWASDGGHGVEEISVLDRCEAFVQQAIPPIVSVSAQ